MCMSRGLRGRCRNNNTCALTGSEQLKIQYNEVHSCMQDDDGDGKHSESQ